MIVCAGEALIDMLPRRAETGEDAYAPYPGGAVLNAAVALGRLGAPSAFLSGLSTDLFGEVLARALEASGVDASLSVRSNRPTTLAFVTLEGGQARYAFYDEGTALRMLEPADMPPLPDAATALFVGGISLASEPCGSAFEALAAGVLGRAALVVDPNVRPAFARDEGAYRERLLRLIGMADVVKASDEDLRWLMGGGSVAELARGALARGPSLVCVTEGADGASAHWSGGAVGVPAVAARVVDTVGAGDTFVAGLMASLHGARLLAPGLPGLGEDALRDALSLGARAAAVTVSRPGADPPWAREIEGAA